MASVLLRNSGRALSSGRTSAFLLRRWARGTAAMATSTAERRPLTINEKREGGQEQRWGAWDRRWTAAAAVAAATAVVTSEALHATEDEREGEERKGETAKAQAAGVEEKVRRESGEEKESEGIFAWAQKKYERAKFIMRNPVVSARPHILPPVPQPHYTLVVDIKDLLYEEIQEDGAKKPRKRPGVDRFLAHLAQFYELVLWCKGEDPMQDSDRAARLDRRMCFSAYIFYNECTMTEEGAIVKDLARLNRPMHNVLLLTSEPQCCQFQPENALVIPAWDGSRDDTTLLDLTYFFEDIASRDPEQTDVRQLLESYEGKDLLAIWRPIRLQHEATLVESQQQLQKMREGGSLLAKLRKI